MSLHDPRCLVCGTPLSKGAPFEVDVRASEVCSDRCYEFYTCDEDADDEQPPTDENGEGS